MSASKPLALWLQDHYITITQSFLISLSGLQSSLRLLIYFCFFPVRMQRKQQGIRNMLIFRVFPGRILYHFTSSDIVKNF